MRRITAIFLLFTFLVSHMSIAIGTHYCEGMAVKQEFMLGHKHLDCGMGDMEEVCENTSDTFNISSNRVCCDNDYYSVEVEDDFQLTVSSSDINVAFVAAFVLSFLDFTPKQEPLKNTYYNPPLVTLDISVLHQVFII